MSERAHSLNSTAGGRQCGDCEEAANELLWCDSCGVSLCFECDSHCHHAKSSRSSHLRVLLSSVTSVSFSNTRASSRQPRSGACPGSQRRSRSARHMRDPGLGPGSSKAAPQSPSKALELCLKSGELHTNNGHCDLQDKSRRKLNKEKEVILSPSPTKTDGLSPNTIEPKSGLPIPRCGDGENCKVLHKSATFPSASNQCLAGQGEDFLHDSDTSSSSEVGSPNVMQSLSLSANVKPKKSALRGGYEETGAGPRPKLSVNWHPEVFDPVCTTVSHTVGRSHRMPVYFSRRSYQKHLRHKSKTQSNPQTSGKKSGGTHKPKKTSDPSISRLHPSSSLNQATKRSAYFENDISNAPPISPDDGLSEDFGLAACIEPQMEGKQNIVYDVTWNTGSCEVQTEEIITSLLESSNDWWDLGESNNKPAEEIREDVTLEKPPNTTVQEEPPSSTLELASDQQNSNPETLRETKEENALSTSASLLTSDNSSVEILRDCTEVAHECKSENEISEQGSVFTCSLGKEALDEASTGDVPSEVLTSGSVTVHEIVASKTDIDCTTVNDVDKMSGNVDGEIEIDESMAMGFPQSCRKAVACMLHAAKLATQGNASAAMVEYEAAARIFREAEKNALKELSLESGEVAKQAVQGQVTAWISVAALYSQKGQICRAEQCHLLVLRACQASGLKLDAGKCLLEAGKCQLRRGECKRAHALFSAATLLFEDCAAEKEDSSKEGDATEDVDVDVDMDNAELQELVVKAGRLAGAAALQGRDVDVGKKLLLGALVAARRLHFKAEEARCLRLLANLQKGEPHLKSLQAAVDSFSVCDLPYEHAEALFCLASLKTTLHLNGMPENQTLPALPRNDLQRVLINSAKQDLEAAANLLQGTEPPTLANRNSRSQNTGSRIPETASYRGSQMNKSSTRSSPEAPVTRPCVKLCVEECGTLCNSPVALELLGRVHEACARACVLIGEVREARTHLNLALKNREWVSTCQDEASQAKALLDRLEFPEPGNCRKSWRALGGSLVV